MPIPEEKYRTKLAMDLNKLDEQYETRMNRQNQLAEIFCRISPFACYIRPMTEVAGTGPTVLGSFREQAKQYENALNREIYYKQTRIRQEGSTGSGFSGDIHSEAPRFQFQRASFSNILSASMSDLLILILYNILFFTGTFTSFLRYDPRSQT
jgi:hypothetical protein